MTTSSMATMIQTPDESKGFGANPQVLWSWFIEVKCSTEVVSAQLNGSLLSHGE